MPRQFFLCMQTCVPFPTIHIKNNILASVPWPGSRQEHPPSVFHPIYPFGNSGPRKIHQVPMFDNQGELVQPQWSNNSGKLCITASHNNIVQLKCVTTKTRTYTRWHTCIDSFLCACKRVCFSPQYTLRVIDTGKDTPEISNKARSCPVCASSVLTLA